MDYLQVKREVRLALTSLDVCHEKGESLVIRCPFCGDSIKNFNHGHMEVLIDMKDIKTPMLYHCHRCDTGGVLRSKLLRTLGVANLQVNSSLTNFNKTVLNDPKYKHLTSSKEKRNLHPSPTTNEKFAIYKKEYIEKRLGIKTTYEELISLRVVLNFADFLRYNDIPFYIKKEFAKSLNKNFVGFLSTHNEFIHFRNAVEEKPSIRYFKYNVLNIQDKSYNFYTIPNKVDITSLNPIHIVLAEGVFDILGLYFNVYDKRMENTIYAAVCGCGFESVIQFFLHKGFVGENIIISIYSDKDRYPAYYTKILNRFEKWVGKINLFYNEKDKDCGVPKERISIYQAKIPKKNYGKKKLK